MLMCTGIECDILTAPDNGNIIIGPRTVGSLAIYICDDGYTLSIPSPAYRQCQVNGSWSRVKPTCNRKLAKLDTTLSGVLYFIIVYTKCYGCSCGLWKLDGYLEWVSELH